MERYSTLLRSAELDKRDNPVARIDQGRLFTITFFSGFLMLITVYLIAFYGLSFVFTNPSGVIEQQEENHVLYRYRTLIYSLSLVPSFLLGMFQMRMTQLVRR